MIVVPGFSSSCINGSAYMWLFIRERWRVKVIMFVIVLKGVSRKEFIVSVQRCAATHTSLADVSDHAVFISMKEKNTDNAIYP